MFNIKSWKDRDTTYDRVNPDELNMLFANAQKTQIIIFPLGFIIPHFSSKCLNKCNWIGCPLYRNTEKKDNLSEYNA